jgi:methylenetetrahydrofolate dehydrogenase (NADP+) / methenyltetrahydrofolate cyclohydrolase
VAELIDGKSIAKRLRGEIKTEVERLVAEGTRPGLAVVLVGEDPGSQIYIRNKTRACREVGIDVTDHRLPASTTERQLLGLLGALNRDPTVHGILVQMPLPAELDGKRAILAVNPAKDVDGYHPDNLGRLLAGDPAFVPCTPLGVMELLRASGTRLEGASAVVVGRSAVVGKPMALLLLAEHATVTICHSRTKDLEAIVSRAEILVVAAGRAGLVRGEWVREGATVVDIGINRLQDGTVVGDVGFEAAAARARAITPVPGGVGPMTVAMLLANTLSAAKRLSR